MTTSIRPITSEVRCGKCGENAVWLSSRKRTVRRGLFAAKLSPSEYVVFVTTAARKRADPKTLIEALYGQDENGGPDDAERAIRLLVFYLNQKIAPLGLSLCTQRPFGWEVTDLHAEEKAA